MISPIPFIKHLLPCCLAIHLSCSSKTDYTTAEWVAWDKDTVSRFPGASWMKHETPAEAGWSAEKLEDARRFWEASMSSAFLVIYDGAVLVSWGEVDRRFLLHSAGKSISNGLFGIAVDEGIMDPDATLGELGLTENVELTALEKSAKLRDLFKFRSGVFIRGANSLAGEYPPRGSAKPGQKWFYNNWDINVCTAIMEREWGMSYSNIFNNRIAGPLQMEHFRPFDIDKVYEVERSRYPGHPGKFTALDLARYGLLFLNQGKWKDEQIISSGWIDESTFPHSRLAPNDVGGGSDYGYNWWVSDNRFKALGMYSARGILGQRLRVIPVADMVVVNFVNSYKRYNFEEEDQLALLDKVLAARVAKPKLNPKLFELPGAQISNDAVDSIGHQFLGEYTAPYKFDPELATMTAIVEYREEGLIVDFQYGNPYTMIKVAEDTYIMEDLDLIEEKRFPMKFYLEEDGRAAFELELAFVLDKVTFRKKGG